MSVRPAHLSKTRAAPACHDVEKAFRQMRDDGHARVAVWGAGDHTRRILGALFDAPVDIACLVDDAPDLQGRRICGWSVLSVDELFARSDVTALLISSRYAPHIERMWATRERLEAAGKQLYRLTTEVDARPSDLALPSVLAITIPKSGTWLLMRLLTLAGLEHYRGNAALARMVAGRDPSGDETTNVAIGGSGVASGRMSGATVCELIPAGHVATLHDPRVIDNTAVANWVAPGHCKVVLLVRDPRDIVVARAHFWKHAVNARHAMLRSLSVCDVMSRLIVGYGSTVPGIYELMMSYRLLYESPLVHVVRFEEIAFAASRPDDPKAFAPIRSLLDHVGLRHLGDDAAREVLSQLEIRPTPGRKTVTDEWRLEFGQRENELFSRQAMGVESVFGYC